MSYTGWKLRPGSNKEHAVVDKTVCASFDSSKHFKKLIEATIAEKYNIDGIQTRILNGDVAKWIKATCEAQDIHFQLDPFHISQAILRNVANKNDQKQLMNFFRQGKVAEGIEALVNIMIANNDDEKVFNKLTTLYDYLVSNRDGLVPYHMRADIKMPTPPEGIEYRSLGTMEHNICDVIAQRMKGRKMSWSISGADNLAKILLEKFSNRLFETVDKIYRNIIPNEFIETINISLPLAASKVNKGTRKSKIYKCPSAQIPYSRAATTIGRKIIRDLC